MLSLIISYNLSTETFRKFIFLVLYDHLQNLIKATEKGKKSHYDLTPPNVRSRVVYYIFSLFD